jgi:hypothetical protein
MPGDPSVDVELQSLEDENVRLREQLASVLESSSWRLTRPLRRLRGSGRPEKVPAPASRVAVLIPEPVPEPIVAVDVESPGELSPPEAPVPMFVAPGHFYSPIVDPAEVEQEPRRSQIWPLAPRATPGVDWREDAQIALCREVFALQERLRFLEDASPDPTEYFALNDQYTPLDAWVLEGMLRWLRPGRVIEVGSGFSSLVTARVNREEFEGAMRFTCIEPYPRQFLIDGVPGVSNLIVSKIQDVPLEVFDSLEDGDILFLDTSHVAKTGSDTTWLFHEVIPRLAPGVIVHVHDIFLPFEYPVEWVREGRSWNENHFVHSFLLYNRAFEIMFGSMYMAHLHRPIVAEAFPGWPDAASGGGGALWLRRCRA